MNTRFNIVLAIAILFIAAHAHARDEAFFNDKVEPILVKQCLECHGNDREGGLDLRTKASVLKGGKSGPAIDQSDPTNSRMLQLITDGEMPPKHPLSNSEIQTIRTWITEGAWFPDRQLDPYAFGTEHRAGYDWWSLQPIKRTTPPDVSNSKDINDIDRFIIARLETENMGLSPSADRSTYIRRVTHNLTGLLPTPDEVDAFINDTHPKAYERLIDRLLQSPHYGERWGRHWLDIVRFAESNGFERDRIRRNFWPYRDYVVQSFNSDKPYDQFVIEQLAGDALEPNNPDHRVAVGFIAAGPKNDVGTISELERLQTRQDELDEMVVATGATFLGLTVGCGRCHDHKFDPIPTTDYYALTAVFSGCNHNKNITVATEEQRQRYSKQVAPLQKKIKALRDEQTKLVQTVRTKLESESKSKEPVPSPVAKLPAVNAERNEDPFAVTQARFIRFTITRTTSSRPCIDELEVYGPESDTNLALASRGSKATASSLLPGYDIHQIHHLNDGKHGNSHSWISGKATGWAQIELAQPAKVNRVVWGRDRNGKYKDRVPVGYRIEVSMDAKQWTKVSDSSRRPGSVKPAPGSKLSDKDVIAAFDGNQRKTYNELDVRIKSVDKQIKAIPPLPSTYSIVDGTGRPEVPVLRRGNVRAHGEMVQAGALTAIAGLDHQLNANSGPQRRLKLAKWITDPANPLAARVMVNRIWQYHFGRGIVDTPSDFGFKGGLPTHPKLLDWLAHDFMTNGWKIKRLHKLIVLSATYRQSSQHNAAATDKDADNRLLWRYSPHRLEAESVRDIILQLSGKLDRKLGGPSFELFAYRDGNVPDYQLVSQPGSKTWRRSIYRYNIRTFRSPLMSAFDCPDPSVATPSRLQSTNPLQALSLLNNYFVIEQSAYMAERIKAATPNDIADQVTHSYRLILLRTPTQPERDRAADFVKHHGLAALCRVLVNSNEFLYVF